MRKVDLAIRVLQRMDENIFFQSPIMIVDGGNPRKLADCFTAMKYTAIPLDRGAAGLEYETQFVVAANAVYIPSDTRQHRVENNINHILERCDGAVASLLPARVDGKLVAPKGNTRILAVRYFVYKGKRWAWRIWYPAIWR